MFGHDNDDNKTTSDDQNQQQDDAQQQTDQPQDGLTLPMPEGMSHEDIQGISISVDDAAAEQDTDHMHSDVPMLPEQPAEPEALSVDDQASEPVAQASSPAQQSLSELKQAALRELSPLINHLNQSTDEKYETAKMVYEETHDHATLNAVFEAAKNLTDEKAKAEAIYDVVQKINQL